MARDYDTADTQLIRSGWYTPIARVNLERHDGTLVRELDARGGWVRYTAGAWPSITAQVDLADPATDIPTAFTDDVTPYGARLRIRCGHTDGTYSRSWRVADLAITDVRYQRPGQVAVVSAASDEVLAAGKRFDLPYSVAGESSGGEPGTAAGWDTDPVVTDDTLDPILPGDDALVTVRLIVITTPVDGGDGIVRCRLAWYWDNCVPTDAVSVTVTVTAATGGGSVTVDGTDWAVDLGSLDDWNVTGFESITFEGATYTAAATPGTPGAGTGSTSAWAALLDLCAAALPQSAVIVDQAIVDTGLAVNTTWDGDYMTCIRTCLGALGAEAWIDHNRDLHLRPSDNPDATVTTHIYLYGALGTVAAVDVAYARAPNRAVVRGSDADGYTIAGAAVPVDGALTRASYGPQHVTATWPASTDSSGLNDQAAALLRATIRQATTTVLSLIPHPWIQLGDRVRVHYDDTTSRDLTVRAIELPLGPGLQRLELVDAVEALGGNET